MVDGGADERLRRTDRGAAIREFAARLRDLRQEAGNPSFREMSGRSRAISHTTLHEAAQGNRLPSWATTVEFVKACDGDPDDYRRPWDEASRQVRAAGTVAEPQESGPDAAAEEPPFAEPGPRRRPVLIGAAAVVTVAVAVIAIVLAARPGGGHAHAAPQPTLNAAPDNSEVGATAAAVRFRAADCPVQQTNPPPAPPAHPGDRGKFVTDVDHPDCSHVARGSTFIKTWRLKNAGTVRWRGYVLHRIDLPARREDCQTITDVPIKDTAPNAFVNVHVEVLTPSAAGFCFVRFRILDAAGRDAFPMGRPLNFQVIVD